jgi:pimeloyl-ACP methyl ester carboxylesterase
VGCEVLRQTLRMPRIPANNIEIEYETFGTPDGVPMLMVNGFTSQLTGVEVGLCEAFAAAGRYVIRYDNRDVGKSTWFDGIDPASTPYTISDMAADGMGLIRALGIESAHIFGMSMGGMLVQRMAINHPSQVRSLTSVMSNTGNRAFGAATAEAMTALLRPAAEDRETYIEQSAHDRAIWSSKKFFDLEWEKQRLARDRDRAFHPQGNARQYAAIVAEGPREDALAQLNVPTLVLHGLDDTLITPSGGERTASLIPGSTLVLVKDMGHDLPRELWPLYVGLVTGHQNRAELLWKPAP